MNLLTYNCCCERAVALGVIVCPNCAINPYPEESEVNVQTVGDLIAKLQKFPPELPVRVLDGFNGGGCARLINLGPVLHDQEDRDDLLEMEVDD